MSLLGCLCAFFPISFFFFLDESFYQPLPSHQIDQTMKSLGLPESKIGPIIHNHCALSLIIYCSRAGPQSRMENHQGQETFYPNKNICWSSFGVGFKFGEMLPPENRKSHTKLVLYFVNVGGGANYLIVSLLCTSFSFLKLAVAGEFY